MHGSEKGLPGETSAAKQKFSMENLVAEIIHAVTEKHEFEFRDK